RVEQPVNRQTARSGPLSVVIPRWIAGYDAPTAARPESSPDLFFRAWRFRQGPALLPSSGNRITLPQPFQCSGQGLRNRRAVDMLGVAHKQELVMVTLGGQHLRHQFGR